MADCENDDECTGDHQVCETGDTKICVCDRGYIEDNGICVAGINDLDQI